MTPIDYVHKKFKRLCRPFLNWRGEFMQNKYQAFFYKNFTKRRFKKIEKLFKKSQILVIEIIRLMHDSPKEARHVFAYYLDLIALVCSELNIKIRAMATDEKRAHVNIYDNNPDDVIKEMQQVYDLFKTDNNFIVVIPSDYAARYNIADYIILIFDKNFVFDLPHFFEAKDLQRTSRIDAKMAKRLQKQREATEKVLKKYDTQLNLFWMFMTEKSYFEMHKKAISKLLKKSEGELEIDDVFSLVVSKIKKRSNANFWFSNILDETGCTSIMPIIFRNSNISLLHQLPFKLKKHLYIKTNRENLLKEIRSLETIKKVEKHPNPFHAWVRFKNRGAFSIANMIHFKFTIENLKHILENIERYSHEQHGKYKNYDIQEHRLPRL